MAGLLNRQEQQRYAARYATALALVLILTAQASAQSRNPDGLRGTGLPDVGADPLPPTGTNPRPAGGYTGANGLAGAPLVLPADSTTPNYGRPRRRADPRLRYAGARRTPVRPLPALTAYPTAASARAARRTPAVTPAPGPTVATIPTLPQKARPRTDDNPYAPVGIGVGSLRLIPFVDVQTGYDSNPNRSNAPPKGSQSLRGEIGATWNSEWSIHQFTGDLRAGYTKYVSDPLANRPDAQGKINLRVDATRDAAFDFELRGQLDTQRPGSANFTPTSVRSRPIVASVGATGGGTQKLGNLELGLHGTLDRTIYEDATLNNGTKLLLSDNSYNTYGLRGRAGYQLTPGVTPFVEAGADIRRRDVVIDSSGFARDSAGAFARAGSTFELNRQLTGEVSAGYAQRKYADARLPTLGGATFDASLVWLASPLTTVTLKGTTNFNETTVANASGAVGRAVSLDVSHTLLRNLTVGAIGTVGVNEYKGINLREDTISGGLRAEYKFNRSLAVRGSFTHERLKSTNPGSDYTANVFLLGLRFQR